MKTHMGQTLTDRPYLSLETTNCLKGIFAIIIVIHHLYQRTDIISNNLIGALFQSMGYLTVAVFFFLSGYGLAVSTEKKGMSYVMSFPLNRLLPFYINNVIMVLVYTVLSVLILGVSVSPKQFLTSFLWGGTVISGGWYLQAILVFYIAYYLIFRFISGTKRPLCIFIIFLICYCAICVLLKFPSTWYGSVFAMPLGMWWVYKKQQIVTALKKHYVLLVGVCFCAFALTLVGYMLCSADYVKIMLKMVSSVFFAAFVAVLIYKIPISCKITRILGKYFFEIYVLQGIAMNFWHSRVVNIENDFIYCAMCFISIAVLSAIAHPIFAAVNKKFKKA